MTDRLAVTRTRPGRLWPAALLLLALLRPHWVEARDSAVPAASHAPAMVAPKTVAGAATETAATATTATTATRATTAAAEATPPCPAASAARWQAIVPGVWIWPGAAQEIGPGNLGQVASQILLRDGHRAILIDPGPSLAHGQLVRESARCALGLTITRVLDSHAHAENVLGNAAFAGAQIEASAATVAGMRARCPQCLASITQSAGAAALDGTTVRLPEASLRPGQQLASDSGRWQMMEFSAAHSDSDLVLWNEDQRLLIAPSLVYQGRIPELAQGSLLGWLAALRQLHRLRPDWVLGQQASRHAGLAGTPANSSGLAASHGYLCALAQGVIGALELGRSANEASEAPELALPAYASWAGHAERHGFNVQRAWRELEPHWMNGGELDCAPLD
ncbi:MAG: hypothetical protein RIS48_1093 [Pseudomonadota bacterium]|uniref:MBL fold metallo-hydrolase n=1 Tax=Malikia spinosa TaxID=86180 RepID=UPI003237C80B